MDGSMSIGRFAERGPWLVLLLVLPAFGQEAARTFRIDQGTSELVVKTHAVGVAAGLAHNHVARATLVSGFLIWSPGNPEKTQISVTVPASSLAIDDPSLRTKYGETKPINESDRR